MAGLGSSAVARNAGSVQRAVDQAVTFPTLRSVVLDGLVVQMPLLQLEEEDCSVVLHPRLLVLLT